MRLEIVECVLLKLSGRRGFTTSCITKVEEGMVVKTNTKELQESRRVVLDLILSNHKIECLTCIRSGNCELQELAKKFNITNIEFQGEMKDYKIDEVSPSIVRDTNKCILCRRCVAACKNVQGIGAIDCANRGTAGYDQRVKKTTDRIEGLAIKHSPVLCKVVRRDKRDCMLLNL